MIRRSRLGIVDFSDDDEQQQSKSYCRKCLVYHLQVPLKNRIYPKDQPIPPDHDQWVQCHNCGSVFALHELEKESTLKDVIETTSNPFDQGKEFLGIDSRKARKKRERQRELEDIKDDEVKRELAKGNTLISYTEYQPQ